MGLKEIRYLKKNIRENIKIISENKIKDKSEIESLILWCSWVYCDCNNLLKEWDKVE